MVKIGGKIHGIKFSLLLYKLYSTDPSLLWPDHLVFRHLIRIFLLDSSPTSCSGHPISRRTTTLSRRLSSSRLPLTALRRFKASFLASQRSCARYACHYAD